MFNQIRKILNLHLEILTLKIEEFHRQNHSDKDYIHYGKMLLDIQSKYPVSAEDMLIVCEKYANGEMAEYENISIN